MVLSGISGGDTPTIAKSNWMRRRVGLDGAQGTMVDKLESIRRIPEDPGERIMLSPLKPLLCRHEFYWSERHRSDLCRRCGKTRAAEAHPTPTTDDFAEAFPDSERRPLESAFAFDGPDAGEPIGSAFFDIPAVDPIQSVPAMAPMRRPSAPADLKAEALERRENLLALLDRIAEGGQPSRRDSLDVILAVIEDAHSADPVLFGSDAAGHFARLQEARNGLIF